MTMRLTVLQTFFNPILQEAKRLPDFREDLVEFVNGLNKDWLEIEKISREFKSISEGITISKEEEETVFRLENRINILYSNILAKKMDFDYAWQSTFERHEGKKAFENFSNLTKKAFENLLLPFSSNLRATIRARSQWIRTKREKRTGEIMRFMTLVFGLVAVIEVLVAYAQIAEESIKNLINFVTPFIL